MYSDIREYFHATFNVNILLSHWEHSLPWAVKHTFEPALITINHMNFLALIAQEDLELEEHAVIAVKQATKNIRSIPVIVFSNKLSAYFESQAIKHGFGFVVPHRSCFIPQFLLQHRFTQDNTHNITKLGVLASMICVLYLEGRVQRLFTTADLSFDASKPAISRAIQELEDAGLIKINRSQRTHKLLFTKDRMSLWKKHESIFSSVCSEPLPINEYLDYTDFGFGNLSALAEYSMLSRPEQPYFVVSMSSRDRLSSPISDTTINSIGETFLKNSNLFLENRNDYRRQAYAQVFPYKPTLDKVNGKAALSPIFTSICTAIKNPRDAAAMAEINETIEREIQRLDTKDMDSKQNY